MFGILFFYLTFVCKKRNRNIVLQSVENMLNHKPIEILKLEKIIKTELEEIALGFDGSGSIPINTYQLNADGKVRLLHIHHYDKAINDLSFLKDFTDLEWLRYGINRLKSIEHLATLSKLKILCLIENDFEDISVLSTLTDLECVFLNYCKIKDISSLSKLSKLKQLKLENNAIEDITPIQNLKNLEILNLGCNRITDISNLEAFPKLVDVCLFQNDISNFSVLNHNNFPLLTHLEIGANPTENYSFLKNLSGLKSLALSEAKITDFSVFENLTKLTSLGLDRNNIQDISFLANLRNLVWLSLCENRITNIDVLQNLIHLKCIELQNNEIQKLPKWLLNFNVEILLKKHNITLSNEGLLRYHGIFLYQNPLSNIPKELLKLDKNVYEELDSYFKGLEKGKPLKNNEVKIIFIGNGSVGKTQIVKRLAEKKKFVFDENHKSTFAIQLLQTHIDSEILEEGLILNCWDFAGQDLYHATHRVFMETRAVFVIVWDWENENNDFHEWNGQKYENQNLRYWLEYATHFGKKSPIIIVQNKVDLEGSRRLPEPEKKKLKAEFLNIVDFLEVSAKANIGFSIFENIISKAFSSNEIIKREILLELPNDWVRLRERIRAGQRNTSTKKQHLTKQQFTKWCEKETIREKDVDVVLTFLHDTGVLFHNTHSLEYEIILDQAWAIKAIFQIVNQETAHYEVLKHNRGELKYSDLCKVWKNYSDTEKTIFISMMKKAELCFEKTDEEQDLKNSVFIVPHFFQDKKPWYIDNYIDDYKMVNKEEIIFSFLPQSLIHRFIVRYNQQAELEDMWQSGIYLKNDDNHIIVEAIIKEKTIIIHHNCGLENEFLKRVKNELYRINDNLPIKAKQGDKDFLDKQKIYKYDINNMNKMSNKPSVLFAFASNDLIGVHSEAAKIWNTVSQNNLVHAIKIENTDVNALGDAIDDCKDLLMFHFGGHANQRNIVLDDFRNLDRIRLSRILGLDEEQHKLQFIFLNGCLSYGHIGILTAKGVKAIIATNVAINDDEAVRLAAAFYKHFFEKGKTLKQAFEKAEARVEGRNSFITIVNPGEIDENQKLRSSWTLFLNSKYQEVMNWTLQDFLLSDNKSNCGK
ncbi:MAG: hypothetical protein RLZZ628_605 [Bacteroidota bacterium]|jgi:internalin A